MYSACHNGHTEIVKDLLDDGVDVNAPASLDALYSACLMGHTEVIKLILDKGADVNAKQAINGLNVAFEEGYALIVNTYFGQNCKCECH